MKLFKNFPKEIKEISPIISYIEDWEIVSWDKGVGKFIIIEEIAEQILSKWSTHKKEFIKVLKLIEEYLIDNDSDFKTLLEVDFFPTFLFSNNIHKEEIINHFGKTSKQMIVNLKG